MTDERLTQFNILKSLLIKSEPAARVLAAAKESQGSGVVDFRKSIRQKLLWRLTVAGGIVAAVLALIVYVSERNYVTRMVSLSAGDVAARFNEQIMGLLDLPTIAGEEDLQQKLEVLYIAGNVKHRQGQLVYAGIQNTSGRNKALVSNEEYEHIGAVKAAMAGLAHRMPQSDAAWKETKVIAGIHHVLLSVPLVNSKGDVVARIEEVVALSPEVVEEIEARTFKTIIQVIAIVLATTAILYPVIQTLFGRLSKLTENLIESNMEMLQVLGGAVAKRDSATDSHNYRVTIYAVHLAEAVALQRSAIRSLIKGAFLHDVGKIGVSDAVLLKPGKLSPEEFEEMKHHVNHGIDIVKRSEWLKDAADIVEYHHEQYGGDGYPFGLSGEEIPISARIFAIADVFDALTSKRLYRSSLSYRQAIELLKEKRGTNFDPVLVDTFVTIAWPLYSEIKKGGRTVLHNKLETILKDYFSWKNGSNVERPL